VRNLSCEEMKYQYIFGMEYMNAYFKGPRPRLLCIILEGMGEASHNIENCLEAFKGSYHQLTRNFDRIVFRISSAGNIDFIDRFGQFVSKHLNVLERASFQCQLSLHSPFEWERRWLMPSISKKNSLKDIMKEFNLLSGFLANDLICNYMLMNFPQGGCNYTDCHLREMTKLLDQKRIELKLTPYSETEKGFSSPDRSKFAIVQEFFAKRGFRAKVKSLIGNDIRSACGMLHYE
jgi:adenine C2-methylase RlmN of 23S rRNA A2503 and tRNA A37